MGELEGDVGTLTPYAIIGFDGKRTLKLDFIMFTLFL